MKKAIGMIISIILTFSLCACSWLQNLSYNAQVETALDALEDGWTEFYAEKAAANSDGYLQIKNTRIVKLNETGWEAFPEGEYVVEFVLYSDYFGAAPYYADAGFMDSVLIYRDGKAELQKMNPVNVYRAANYKMDIVSEVIDLGDTYNRTWDLKK